MVFGLFGRGWLVKMVKFPDLSNLTGNPTIGDFMAFPNSSYPFFWAWIFAGLWIIIALASYFAEKAKVGRGNFLSSMAISSFAIILLATIGTVVGFVTLEIMIPLLVICVSIIGIWFFSNENA